MAQYEYGTATDVGLLRANNEDALLAAPELGLWVVADGMGGHEAGEVASDIAQQAIRERYAKHQNLTQAVLQAHEAILNAVAAGIGKAGMGSTVVALATKGTQFEIAWVGDSRAYLYSPFKRSRLQQLSTDHSYVQSLFKSGLISREEMATHPDKNIITQCLGSTELDRIQVDSIREHWHKDQRLLLCSDGLTDCVSEPEIAKLLGQTPTPQAAADALIQAALSGGGRDNITAVVARAH